MSSSTCRVVVGVFDTHAQAERATSELRGSGFGFDQVRLLTAPSSHPGTGLGSRVGSLTGTTASAAAAGVHLAELVGMGVPEQEVRFYEQELQAGRAVITVLAGDRSAEARTILHGQGAYDAARLRCATGSPHVTPGT